MENTIYLDGLSHPYSFKCIIFSWLLNWYQVSAFWLNFQTHLHTRYFYLRDLQECQTPHTKQTLNEIDRKYFHWYYSWWIYLTKTSRYINPDVSGCWLSRLKGVDYHLRPALLFSLTSLKITEWLPGQLLGKAVMTSHPIISDSD